MNTELVYQTLKISEIKTSTKYIEEIPRQTQEERKTMLESIIQRGINKPLEMSNLTGLLVDGYERFTVGKEANLEEFPIIYKNFESELEEFQYIVDNTLCRRSLTTWWVGKLNHINVELQKELAEQRQKLGKKIHESEDKKDNLVANLQQGDKGRSVEIATKGKPISPRSQSSVEKILKSNDQELIKKLDNHEITTHKAERLLIQKENESRPNPPLPAGKFTDIVTDNGWDFGNKNIGGSGKSGAGFHYKTESTNKIARIPVVEVAANNALLYEYTTNQHLITGSMLMSEYYEILNEQKLKALCKKTANQDKIKKLKEQAKADNELLLDILKKQKVQSDALAVMHCHGFTPKCIVTWEKEEKEGWGGYWLNNTTEHLIIGIRGEVPAFGLSEKTIVKSKYVPRSHSKKPEEMWQLIEKCVAITKGNHRKLEMNCRTPRKGWYPHGDQITAKDIEEWQKK